MAVFCFELNPQYHHPCLWYFELECSTWVILGQYLGNNFTILGQYSGNTWAILGQKSIFDHENDLVIIAMIDC